MTRYLQMDSFHVIRHASVRIELLSTIIANKWRCEWLFHRFAAFVVAVAYALHYFFTLFTLLII